MTTNCHRNTKSVGLYFCLHIWPLKMALSHWHFSAGSREWLVWEFVFGRVSSLCQVLITVERWHAFSAALQSNKKSQEEHPHLLQCCMIHTTPLSPKRSPPAVQYSLPQYFQSSLFYVPKGDLGPLRKGNSPFLPSTAEKERYTVSYTSVMCPQEKRPRATKLTNCRKHINWSVELIMP